MSGIRRAIDGGHIHTYQLHAAVHQKLRGIGSQTWMIAEVSRRAPLFRPARLENRRMPKKRRSATLLDMLAADLTRGGVTQIDESRGARTALERYVVDGLGVVEEVKRRVHVRAGVYAKIYAAHIH